MASITIEREMNAPAEKVWALANDYSRWGEWNTMFTKWVSEPPAEVSDGTQLTAVLTVMGMANTLTLTVSDYNPPKNVALSGTGMAGAEITMTLRVEPKGDQSVMAMQADFISQMMVGAIGSAIERTAAKELDSSLIKLSELVS
ncbi:MULTISPECIES: SRPBCC family protein [Mycobacteroides]|uniref:Polyketide cyclase n=1 Tax=Mycobacteroides chelonae TaxID=1774 RepID=A0A1S1MAW7_MYCCH|nr:MULTISPECIES: SRPBCC family protein [Mycobacteroides]KRQ18302.1 hypothetical protein AOT87_20815 [Mycobacteroides sp. H003]KRQ25568.1 hypothetical protein AOT91_20445 [Mycobacteroides sp. H092]KRQ33642.1 hypothetical protein AOT92_26750 [Mycobacteroides sp. H101]KRQ45199.1 hypothetical protein AOT88_20490 [Mycobacteroides sp. H063]KRQ56260.1 hypothetical protein AOT94_19355 [Mycobacteroides sp. HXVII]